MIPIAEQPITLALCGDVMTGRGIDQILPHPGHPALYESYVRDARDYVQLAMDESGTFALPVDYEYVWGDARGALQEADVRIANLETSVTTADEPWPAKGIHYRMHPGNIGCLTAAHLSCCGLANNHVLDWGHAGLAETLQTLDLANIAVAGAGRDLAAAAAPATLAIPGKGRVLVVAVGFPSSGIPPAWAATPYRPGVNLLASLAPETARDLAHDLLRVSRPHDVTVVSIHWGENWGYKIPSDQIEFAHTLIDEGIDVVHGHSSHHAKAIELRRGGVILYGCGDFLNDYEGIGGNEEFRPDLALLYKVSIVTGSRRQADVSLLPLRLRQMRLNHARDSDARWLCTRLHEQSAAFGTTVQLGDDNSLRART